MGDRRTRSSRPDFEWVSVFIDDGLSGNGRYGLVAPRLMGAVESAPQRLAVAPRRSRPTERSRPGQAGISGRRPVFGVRASADGPAPGPPANGRTSLCMPQVVRGAYNMMARLLAISSRHFLANIGDVARTRFAPSASHDRPCGELPDCPRGTNTSGSPHGAGA